MLLLLWDILREFGHNHDFILCWRLELVITSVFARGEQVSVLFIFLPDSPLRPLLVLGRSFVAYVCILVLLALPMDSVVQKLISGDDKRTLSLHSD